MSPVVVTFAMLTRAVLSESVNGLTTSLERIVLVPSTVVNDIDISLASDLVVADLLEFVVALHEVIVWVNDDSTVVKVWVDICPPAVVSVLSLALSAAFILITRIVILGTEWDVLTLASSVADTVGRISLDDLLQNSLVALLWSADLGWVKVGTLLGLDTLTPDVWALKIGTVGWSTLHWVVAVVNSWLLVDWALNLFEWWAFWAVVWHAPLPVAVADTESAGSVEVPSEPSKVVDVVDWSGACWADFKFGSGGDAAVWAGELPWLPVKVTHADEKLTLFIRSHDSTDIPSPTILDTVWETLWNNSWFALRLADYFVSAVVTVGLTDVFRTATRTFVAVIVWINPSFTVIDVVFHTKTSVSTAVA